MRASIIVENYSDRILIDCGPDFRNQMLRFRPQQPNALLITHLHYDHVAGIDDLRPFTRKSPLCVYAEKRGTDGIREKYNYMFQEHKYPGIADVDLITIHRTPFLVGKTLVTPIRLFHYQLPVLGYRIGDFAYLTDFTLMPESELVKLKGVKVLIIEALRRTKHLSHLSLDEAIQLSEKIGVQKVFFTHICHQMGLHGEIEKILPPGMHLAYDGLSFEF